MSTVLDETYKVAVTRFENRIRVGGMAELAGFDLSLKPQRRKTLEMVVEDLFPGAGALARGEFWTGLRPMTPDSTPIIGATAVDRFYVSTGHGTLGWTMAAGSGRFIADLMTGRRPDIDPAGLGIDRYRAATRPPGGSLDSPHEPSGAHPHRSRCAASQLPVAAPSTRWPALAVLKADAYGHGAIACARALAACADGFAVAFGDEAAALRAVGVRAPLLVLEGVFSPAELRTAARERWWLVVHHQQQIEMIERCAIPAAALDVWLKSTAACTAAASTHRPRVLPTSDSTAAARSGRSR